MTYLHDDTIFIVSKTYEGMKTMIKACGIDRVPVKDCRFIISIKGEDENEKN